MPTLANGHKLHQHLAMKLQRPLQRWIATGTACQRAPRASAAPLERAAAPYAMHSHKRRRWLLSRHHLVEAHPVRLVRQRPSNLLLHSKALPN
eukprot:1161323-Amphidinium_carterae.1